LAGTLLLAASSLLSQPEQKRLSVYAPQAGYELAIALRDGREYVDLLDFLAPLGSVSARVEGPKWKLRFNRDEAIFAPGKTGVRFSRTAMELTAPLLMENGRGLVAAHDLARLLMGLLPGPHSITFHESSRRLFLDSSETTYRAELRKGAPPKLVLTFTAPVNPFIATEPGKLRMSFRREPLLPGPGGRSLRLDDQFFSSLDYAENNGAAELTVSGSAPLIASFSPDRRSITISPVSRPEPKSPPPAGGAPPEARKTLPPAEERIPQGSALASGANLASVEAGAGRGEDFVVLIDPAHGGGAAGAALGEKLTEKELTLAIARRLRSELQARGIAARLLRDGDADFPDAQRAVMANLARPALYVSVHASSAGTGVHVFTSTVNARPAAPVFLPWDTAQAAYVSTSHAVAGAVATELLKLDIPALDLAAAIMPLDEIAAPALAVEISNPVDGAALDSPQYQQSVCAAVASAIAGLRGKLARSN
jgi:N-acetylmuramoyl-L-alanine amidase